MVILINQLKTMKTAEEKAREASNDYGIDDIQHRTMFASGYLQGYTEAMRWRDPKEELPEYKGEYFQILLKNPNGIYFLREIFSQDNIDYLLLVEGDYCVWRPIE